MSPLALLAWVAGPTGRYVALALAIIIGLGAFTWRQRAAGAQAERLKIEKQDRTAIDAARNARDDHRHCSDRNGVFDPFTRKCSLR